MSIACYISNRAYIKTKLGKTPYKLYNGRKPNQVNLHIFACKCFIHNNSKGNKGMFDSKANEGIFVGYCNQSKA